MNRDTPDLPRIDKNLLRDVLARHPQRNDSSPPDNTEHGGAERLAELGHTVLSMTIMYILFMQKPFESASDLSEKHKEFMDDAHIKDWLTRYDLKSKVTGIEDRSSLDDPMEERLLFSSYVGALYLQKGMTPLLTWITRLVCPQSKPLSAPGKNSAGPPAPPPYPSTTAPAPPSIAPAPPSATRAPPSTAPVPPSTPAPSPTRSEPQVNMLALFNQTCIQRGITINWQAVAGGPAHLPCWEVKCVVNDVIKGSGTGRNQKVAKEAAARQAFEAMGWGRLQ